MGALTGNTVQSTYLDLVQLGQSGAGLPSHAGKEAALYDGAGYQILGRTAVRHWLDPHPDAASFTETWEFSTKGDMTQAALEAAGWTFSNCTGVVENGILWLSSTATANPAPKAYLTVSLAGDFDFMAAPIIPFNYGSAISASYQYFGSVGVGESTGGVAHHVAMYLANVTLGARTYINGTIAGLAGTGASKSAAYDTMVLRCSRVSGTVYLSCTSGNFSSYVADDTSTNFGKSGIATVADATTFNRLFLSPNSTNYDAAFKWGWAFLRRFQ